jgi:hypothetical protein
MVNAGDFHDLIFDSINHNVGQSRKEKLPCAVDPTRATTMRKAVQTVAAVINSLRYVGSCSGIVFLNVTN